jgi:hypothetical protein
MPLKRRQAFFEIGQGALFSEVQQEYERAQDVAVATRLPAKVKLEILVYPPREHEPDFGDAAYRCSLVLPSRKPTKFTTQLENGRVVSDGKTISEVINEDFLSELGMDTISVITNRMQGAQS